MMQQPEEPATPLRDCSSTFASRAACWFAATLLLAATGLAQPHAEGAVSTLEDKPKGATVQTSFSTVCAISAEDLIAGHGCAGLVDCTLPGACDFEGGLDHVAAGTGLRNRGAGTVQLAGAPPGAVAVGAWLYWGVIADDNGTGQLNPAAIVLDGQLLTGDSLEATPEPCWIAEPGESPPMFRAYRRDVLDRLQPAINGQYQVDVPSSSVTDGRDPWRDNPVPHPWVEGASLVVLYSHPDVPRAARFYLHEGPALLVGDQEVAHDLPALDPTPLAGSVLRHTRLGGDGQRRAGHAPTYPFSTEISWQQWCGHAPLQIAGPGSLIDPVSDWKGADGGPITQLWDTHLTELPWTENASQCDGYHISYNTLEPAEAPETGNSGFFYDCVVVVAHALTVR